MKQALVRTEPVFESDFMRMVENELNSSFWKTVNMFSPSLGKWVPAVDVLENQENIIFSIDIAGIPQQDIDLEYEDGYLTISGKRESLIDKEYAEDKNTIVHRHELRHGDFSRSFRLPDATLAEDIAAKHEAGMLYITVKKPSTTKAEGYKIPIVEEQEHKEISSHETKESSMGKEKISLGT